MKTTIPFREYNSNLLRGDLLAGLTVVVMIIPQAMAYSVLAGMPAVYGLYAALVPLIVYPLLGASVYLSVGPVALLSILIVSGLSAWAEPMSPDFIAMAITVSFLAGFFQLLMSVCRLGFLANFLSHPVLSGFTSAAGVIIIISQLKYAFGISTGRSSNTFHALQDLLTNLDQTNILCVSISMLSLVALVVAGRIKKSFPAALLLTLLSGLLVYFFELDGKIAVIGEVPAGLAKFELPQLTNWASIKRLLPLSLVIALISFIESLVIAKALGARHGQYSLNANQELRALGLAKIAGSFFQSFPSTGSFARSAINESSGARTGMSSIFAALFVALSLVFFSKFFYYIPYAVLAAIVIAAVINLIDWREAKSLLKSDKGDFWVLLVTFLTTTVLGVQIGVITGIVLSLLLILRKVSTPHYAILGKIDEGGIYRNVSRFEKAEVDKDTLIFRYDENVFFGNAEHFSDAILDALDSRPETLNLVLDMSSVSHIDSTGIQRLKILLQTLSNRKIEVHLAGVKGPVRDRLKEEDMYHNYHLSIDRCMEKLR